MRKPPTTGPDAAATPAVAPQAANAVARSRPWNVLDRIASVAGSISDAPMPFDDRFAEDQHAYALRQGSDERAGGEQ